MNNNLNNNMNNNLNNIDVNTINSNSNDLKKKKGINKKIILIVMSAIILGIVGFLLLNSFKKNSSLSLGNSFYDPNKPIVIEKNGRYGYINSQGKIIIEPKYISVNEFNGEYAVVSVDNPEEEDPNEVLYKIIDTNGNIKLTSDYVFEPKYYPEYDVWLIDEMLYDSKLNSIFSEEVKLSHINYGYFEYNDYENDESAIITYKGEKIFTNQTPYLLADISENEYNQEDLYASVLMANDPEKEIIVSLKTGDILFSLENAEKYNIMEKENGIFLIYDKDHIEYDNYLFFINNKLAYKTTEEVYEVEVYDYQNQILEIDYGYDYEELGKEQRMYYYDVKNNKMLEKKPTVSVEDLETILIEKYYGFKEYIDSGKYGIMSGEKLIVPCEYDNIEYLDIKLHNYMKSKGKELVLLEKDKKTTLYNLNDSKEIITFNSNTVYSDDSSIFIESYLGKENGTMIYNLLSNKTILSVVKIP